MHLDFWHGLALYLCLSLWPLGTVDYWRAKGSFTKGEQQFLAGVMGAFTLLIFNYLVGAQSPIPMW